MDKTSCNVNTINTDIFTISITYINESLATFSDKIDYYCLSIRIVPFREQIPTETGKLSKIELLMDCEE